MADDRSNDLNEDTLFSTAGNAGRIDRDRASRNYTSEERTAVALEVIADCLGLIEGELRSINHTISSGRVSITQSSSSSEEGRDRWDNEGGCFTEDGALDPDLVRTMEQHYAVGPYHNTDLQDATAKAERLRRSGQSSDHAPPS